jgi:hypothetical protein
VGHPVLLGLGVVWQCGAPGFAAVSCSHCCLTCPAAAGCAHTCTPALFAAVAATTREFWAAHPTAGKLMLPYLAFTGYASALNYSFWQNNPDVSGVVRWPARAGGGAGSQHARLQDGLMVETLGGVAEYCQCVCVCVCVCVRCLLPAAPTGLQESSSRDIKPKRT